MSQNQIVNKEDLVVRFAGDSGDGMQLSGTLFSDASALTGWVTTSTALATSATSSSP